MTKSLTFIFLVLFSKFAYSGNCDLNLERKTQLNTQIKNLNTIKDGLRDFSKGELLKGQPLSTLFVVNLEDLDQINTRIEELAKFVVKTPSAQCEKTELGVLSKKLYTLEAEINSLRLTFLKLPQKQRAALIALQQEAKRNQEDIDNAIKAKEKAIEKIESADEAIRKAENLSLNSESINLKDLAAQIVILEKFRKTIAEQSSSISEKIKKSGAENREQTEKLSELAAILSNPDASAVEIEKAFNDVVVKWRNIVDDVVQDNFYKEDGLEISLPKFQESIIKKAKNEGLSSEVNSYEESYRFAKSELEALEDLRIKVSTSERDQRYRELVLVGQVRSQLLRMLESFKIEAPFKLSDSYFQDIVREVKLVPYRPIAIFVSALTKVKDTASSGIEGIIDLVKKAFALSLFFLIPIVALVGVRRALRLIEDNKRSLFRGKSNKSSIRFFTWLHRLQPYIPWVSMLLALQVSKAVVVDTEVEWVAEILAYFSYYFIYRLFREVIDSNLIAINSFSGTRITPDTRKRIEATSKFIGLFFLLSAYLLEATAAVARRALFYRLVLDSLIWICPLIISLATFYWRKEIRHALKQVLSPDVNLKVSRLLSGPAALIFSLPAAIFLVLTSVFERLKGELLEVDTIKSISAQLFRKKIESNVAQVDEKSRHEIKSSYRVSFLPDAISDDSFLVKHQSFYLNEITDLLHKWSSGDSEERTIAIYGEKGVGKSSLLNSLASTKGNFESLRVSVDKKITSEKELKDFLSGHCNINLNETLDIETALYEYDNTLDKKRVIFIDDCQNFFLGHRKGFKSFRLLSSIISQNTKNILWCVSFNYYSWKYLNAVNNGSQLFRRVFKVSTWSDEEIKELILKRHKSTGLSLEFDPIIFALGSRPTSETYEYLQDRFFELLWEQSKGNPRTAMALWITALSAYNSNKLRVGLPGGNLAQKIEGITDEQLFVVAAIARHESLTTNQAIQVTGLDDVVVQHTVRVGVDRGFLNRSDSGYYRLTPLWQPLIIKTLVGKNLLYG